MRRTRTAGGGMHYGVFADRVTPVGTKRRHTSGHATGIIFLLLPTPVRGDHQLSCEILKRGARLALLVPPNLRMRRTCGNWHVDDLSQAIAVLPF